MSPLTHPPLTVNRPESRASAGAPAGGFAGLLWLTWRQHRWALLGSFVLSAVLVVWTAYLAADMTNLYHQCHDTICPPGSPQDVRLNARFYGLTNVSADLLLVVRYMPLLFGMFIGVPLLAREHEQRTLLLAWSQDVSPARWLWTKLALLGLYVAALTAAVSGVSDHLTHVLSAVTGDSLFADWEFLASGMLPLAASVCWFAIGVALGAAVRRTLPAVFAAIGGFVGLMLAVQWRYPTLTTPVSAYKHFDQPDDGTLRNALLIKGGSSIGPGLPSNLFDPTGHELGFAALNRLCPDLMTNPGTTMSCFARNHLQSHVIYQPADRIPEFHLILAAGYLGLAAVALAAAWLIIRRTNLSIG